MKILGNCTILIICIFSCTYAQVKKGPDGIIGKIKSYTFSTYFVTQKFGEIEKGALNVSFTLKYDIDNHRTEYNLHAPGGQLVSKLKYTNADNGNNIVLDSYKPDGSLEYRTKNKFNDKGHNIESSQYQADGSLEKKSVYKVDDNGNRIQIDVYNSENILNENTLLKYDDKGQNIQWTLNDIQHNLTINCFIKYDDNGNIIEELRPNSNKVTFSYDIKDRLILQKTSYHDDSITATITYKYENEDKNGNWLKRLTLTNGQVDLLTERTIEYY